MTFKVQGTITVNGAQAKAEVAAVSGELKKAATETTGFAKAGTQAAQAGQALKAAAGGAAGGVSTVAVQAQQAAANFVRMGDSAKLSAGAVGNLTAQFNDIGMMMAAGQNPLMLAIQQGTQISQVIGPMGAAGAVRALGSAFLALLSPVNLVTLGVIAGSAALVNWISSTSGAADEVASLEEAMDGLSGSVDRYVAAIDAAGASSDELRQKYGAMAEAAKVALENIAAAEKASTLQAMATAIEAIKNNLLETRQYQDGMLGGVQTVLALKDSYGMTADEVGRVREALTALVGASGLPETAAAAQDVNDALIAAYGSAEAMPGPLLEVYGQMAAMVEEAALVQGATEAATVSIWDFVAATASGQGGLAGMAAEAGNLAAAAANAASNIWSAMKAAADQRINAQARLKEIAFENSPGGQALMKYGGRGTAVDTPVTDGRGFQLVEGQFVDPNAPRITSGRAGVGGGGGGAARAEADAVGTLIEKLRAEVEVARELDPIAKEMLRYRTQLKDATEEERAAVEALIAQREREKATMASMEFVSDAAGNAMIDALMGASDAGEKLIDTLKRAVLQAVLLGEGPLGGLLGGGIFKGLFGGGGETAPPGFARGGWTGSGATTDVAGVVHAEEYVFDAAATRRIGVANLEALRRAARRGYRSGGFVTDGRPVVRDSGGARSGDEAARRAVFEINVSGTGNSEIRVAVQEALRVAFDEYSNRQLPGLVRQVQIDRWGD